MAWNASTCHRSFDTLVPNSHYSQICGRKFVRHGRIVGGHVASYAEWPWQVGAASIASLLRMRRRMSIMPKIKFLLKRSKLSNVKKENVSMGKIVGRKAPLTTLRRRMFNNNVVNSVNNHLLRFLLAIQQNAISILDFNRHRKLIV